MRTMRAVISLLACAVAVFITSAALAQATNYRTVETTSGKRVQLSYHASAHTNCTPAPPPTIKVTEPPKDGALIVQKGMLATNKFAGCGRIKVPVQVVFYQSGNGYTGSDHVIYEVTDSNGQVTTYDVGITVQSGPPPAGNGNPKGTKI
jgi:hypothetical protein